MLSLRIAIGERTLYLQIINSSSNSVLQFGSYGSGPSSCTVQIIQNSARGYPVATLYHATLYSLYNTCYNQ